MRAYAARGAVCFRPVIPSSDPVHADRRFRTVAWTLVRLDAQSRTLDLSPPVRDELQEAWAVVLWLADFLHDNEERLRRVH
ncbi:MAG: hypothetical protein ACM3SX_16240 [Deltaproteobacteria bacterium]